MGRPGWRKRAKGRLVRPAEAAAAGLLLLFLSRAGVSIPAAILAGSPAAGEPVNPNTSPGPRRVRDLGIAEVVE